MRQPVPTCDMTRIEIRGAAARARLVFRRDEGRRRQRHHLPTAEERNDAIGDEHDLESADHRSERGADGGRARPGDGVGEVARRCRARRAQR